MEKEKSNSETNVRQFRLTEERKNQLAKIQKNPLFKNFVSESTGKIKLAKLINFLFEKALDQPMLFFKDEVFEEKDDLMKMVEENIQAIHQINELHLQLFGEVFEKLDQLDIVENKLDQLATFINLTFQQVDPTPKQPDNIFDNDEELSSK